MFSSSLREHFDHLGKVLNKLSEVGLKLNPAKCCFLRKEVEYLGHVITRDGLKPNAKLIAAVQNYANPRNIQDLRRFLGLASYYRRFVPQFAKTAHPLHQLTHKDVDFQWSDACDAAFRKLKQCLVSAPVLAYPSFDKDFMLETDASVMGLGAVLTQIQPDGFPHPIAFASRALSPPERNYGITDLETLAVVWALSHFHYYLYGHKVTVMTDHTAVKAVLDSPNPSGRHARWWTRVFGQGIREVSIIYRPGKENIAADALSRSPCGAPPVEGIGQNEVQVATVNSNVNIPTTLALTPCDNNDSSELYAEQRKDPSVVVMINYLEKNQLPQGIKQDRVIAAKAPSYCVLDGILYFINGKKRKCRLAVVPQQLRKQVMEQYHGGPLGGHYSGNRLYNILSAQWYWDGMYADCLKFCRSCPQCAIVSGGERNGKQPLHPIPVQRPFQILGLDIMDLPATEQGNKHVVVFQDYFTKWPMVFPVPDQKTLRIAELLTKEVIPFCGVPEAVLTDRGTNLLSHLMLDICSKLGITKMNTTAYHPECDGMVERFNRTLKSMLRKHADKFGTQWDKYLPGLLWAYRNTPHESTGEKPSFLLFGVDCRTPTESALLSPNSLNPTEVSDYREELMLSLSSARTLAASQIQKAQSKYKKCYDKKTKLSTFKVGQWVLVRFPHEETGRMRKLSRPWHGPFRVVSRNDPDITVSNVYFPNDTPIKVHQNRVSHCPKEFPAGYYWYGGKRKGTGAPPAWVDKLLNSPVQSDVNSSGEITETVVTDISESEGQNSNSPNDVLNDKESNEDSEQQADAQPEVNVTPRSERSQYSLRDSTKNPRDSHDCARVELS